MKADLKELICPHCKKPHPFRLGFLHDQDLNILCRFCGKIIFAVTPEAEREVKRVLGQRTSYAGDWKKEPLPIKPPLVPDSVVPVRHTGASVHGTGAHQNFDGYD